MSTTGAADRKKMKKSKSKGEDISNKRPYPDDHDESQPKKSKKIKREAHPGDVDLPLAAGGRDESEFMSKKEKKKKKKSKIEAVGADVDGLSSSATRDAVQGRNVEATVLDAPMGNEAGPSYGKGRGSIRPEVADLETEAQMVENAQALKKSKKKKKRQLDALDGNAPRGNTNEDELDDIDGIGSAGFGDEMLEKHTAFVQHTASFYLTLSPCAYNFPLEGICAEHLSPLLLTYYPPLHGIVLSYSNARLAEVQDETVGAGVSPVLSQSINEYAVSFLWLTADFTIFRPRRGTYLEGHVNLQNESLLGLVCYNFFNASIERARLPEDWQWIGDQSGVNDEGKGGAGYFVDGQGKKVEGKLTFKAKDFDATPSTEHSGGTINIVGTLLSPAQDKMLDA
nr:dna-directed rna polymerase i subunit rpa43 [Quercus suber]